MRGSRPLLGQLVTAAASKLRAEVVAAEPLSGGYTPQLLYQLRLADGHSVVLKAAPPNPEAPGALDWASGRIDWSVELRVEAHAYHALPMLAAWQPQLLGEFEQDGWVALLLEDLSGAEPIVRWTPAASEVVAHELAAMHAVTYEMSSPPELSGGMAMEPFFDQIRARGRRLGHLPASWDTPEGWDWLERACRQGAEAVATGFGDVPRAVLHGDVRSDNLFLSDGRMVLIDWPDARWDSVARESVYWALGVEAEGGEPAPHAHARYLAHARPVPECAIQGALARQCGYFLDRLQAATLSAGLMAYFRGMLGPTVAWFAQALGLPAPPG